MRVLRNKTRKPIKRIGENKIFEYEVYKDNELIDIIYGHNAQDARRRHEKYQDKEYKLISMGYVD